METGKKLNGRYKIKRTIGTGGMANVFLARDLILDRDVAVKVLRYDFRNDENTIRRFKREALAAAELVHPNIVGVYDVGEEEHTQYIVMEYVKGMDLKQYIKETFPIPYRKVINIMDQILSAVNYAHQSHIVHRDLKPQNVLIDEENGVVKITDFGIAVALSQTSITQTNSLLGSVHYLSPEQARGGMATNQSDIYSLGIILYELLTGNVPFDGESAVSIALKHFQESLPSVKEFDPRIPQPLENVVLKATAKEPADRYSTVYEMAVDLETALSPQRNGEPKFVPMSMSEETKVLTPVKPVVPNSPEEAKNQEDSRSEEGQEKPTKKKKKKRLILTLLSIVVLSVAGFFAVVLSAPDDVSIPNVSGMSEEEAEATLIEAGLSVGDVIVEANEEIEEDVVIRTNPEEGLSIKEETQIDLYISSGKATVFFGDYIGESYSEVEEELTEQGFEVERQEESSDSVPEGSIIEQSVEENTEVVPSETSVLFTVSTGEAGFEMRDLTGYSQRGVQDYAMDNDLNLTIVEEYSDEIPVGQVITQTPEAGELIYSDTDITVTLSRGPEVIPLESFVVTVTIPYGEADDGTTNGDTETTDENAEENQAEDSAVEPVPATITIYIEDAEHSLDTIYQQLDITQDTEVDLSFVLEEGDTGSYRIERDGEVILEDYEVAP